MDRPMLGMSRRNRKTYRVLLLIKWTIDFIIRWINKRRDRYNNDYLFSQVLRCFSPLAAYIASNEIDRNNVRFIIKRIFSVLNVINDFRRVHRRP